VAYPGPGPTLWIRFEIQQESRHGQAGAGSRFCVQAQAFLSSKYGYQEVHAMYDEMRIFFAKRATSTYQNEVATIKVILMSMKLNNKNPQMVMVRRIS
jgi:hypothetical protein